MNGLGLLVPKWKKNMFVYLKDKVFKWQINNKKKYGKHYTKIQMMYSLMQPIQRESNRYTLNFDNYFHIIRQLYKMFIKWTRFSSKLYVR